MKCSNCPFSDDFSTDRVILTVSIPVDWYEYLVHHCSLLRSQGYVDRGYPLTPPAIVTDLIRAYINRESYTLGFARKENNTKSSIYNVHKIFDFRDVEEK